MKRLLILALFSIAIPASHADVYFEEELINPGFGKNKTGARTTRHTVYVKGGLQKVDAQIIVDKKTERILQSQGQPLRSSTILNLGRSEVFEINLDAQTVVRTRVPGRRDAAAKSPAKPAQGAQPNVAFAFKSLGDSAVVAGISCRKVVAQMRARYDTGKKTQRENRYTYSACIADAFPGWNELRAFSTRQDTTTSYPALISGGLDPLRTNAAEINQLQSELQDMNNQLNGLALQSTLTASVQQAGSKRWAEVFRLERQIKKIRTGQLPDSLFAVPNTLTQVNKK
jgi:hypothetical protein